MTRLARVQRDQRILSTDLNSEEDRAFASQVQTQSPPEPARSLDEKLQNTGPVRKCAGTRCSLNLDI